MKILVKAHGLISLDLLDNKTFKVLKEETVLLGPGQKIYYTVEFEGREYEVAEDLCEIVN